MNEPERLALLAHLLNSELPVSRVAGATYSYPARFPAAVVPSARLILLVNGGLSYTVEAVSMEMEAPLFLLVPAWVQREWRLGSGGHCSLLWCEFSPRLFDPSFRDLLWAAPGDPKLEHDALARMKTLWSRNTPVAEGTALALQGELKAVLARFLSQPVRSSSDAIRHAEAGEGMWDAEVRQAIDWINRHFQRSDAGSVFAGSGPFSRAPFRREFRRRTGMSPAAYLQLLRMRYARFLLKESGDSIKEIAAAAGFNDPLYFSRRYRSFWGHSPKRERLER